MWLKYRCINDVISCKVLHMQIVHFTVVCLVTVKWVIVTTKICKNFSNLMWATDVKTMYKTKLINPIWPCMCTVLMHKGHQNNYGKNISHVMRLSFEVYFFVLTAFWHNQLCIVKVHTYRPNGIYLLHTCGQHTCIMSLQRKYFFFVFVNMT